MAKLLYKEMNDDIKEFTQNTGKPVDTWVEEEVPVQKNKFDPTTGKIMTTYDLEKVRTKYINAPKEKFRCKSGEHYFRIFNAKRWMFACNNCPLVKRVFPTKYTLKDGKLINKVTHIPV